MIVNHQTKALEYVNDEGFQAVVPPRLYHTLALAQSGRTISVSPGMCRFMGEVVFDYSIGGDIDIPISDVSLQYEIWLTRNGLSVVSREPDGTFGDLIEPIFILSWFYVPVGTESLDNVPINVILIEDTEEPEIPV